MPEAAQLWLEAENNFPACFNGFADMPLGQKFSMSFGYSAATDKRYPDHAAPPQAYINASTTAC